jgi:hypothetical protein
MEHVTAIGWVALGCTGVMILAIVVIVVVWIAALRADRRQWRRDHDIVAAMREEQRHV